MPCWYITILQKNIQSLISNTTQRTLIPINDFKTGITATHVKFNEIVHLLRNNVIGETIIDQTGIGDQNIDINLIGDLLSMDDIKKQLEINGFQVVKGTKEMLCLVISDPK